VSPSRTLATAGITTIAWAAAFAFGRATGATLASLGALSLVVMAACAAAPSLRPPLRLSPRDVAAGLGAGAALGAFLLGATVVVYPWLRALLPPLAGEVRGLYASMPVTAATFPLVVAVVVAEELVWRGAALEALRARGVVVAALASSIVYALGQAGSGLWVLPALALLLGALWALCTLVLRSALASLVAHAIWTLGVFTVWPLER
jgi:membrane protease YdiL (CAAX protease family)